MATRSRPDLAQLRARARAPKISRWYYDLGKDQARERGLYARDADPYERANYIATKRELRIRTLATNVKHLRQVFRNFDSSDGFNLRDIKSWPKSRVKKIDQYAEYLNHLRSQPFQVVRPRNKAQRIALETLTGQRLPEQKAFVVHKPSDTDEVEITRDGYISITRQLPGDKGFLRSEFYLFEALLGYRPVTWDELYSATLEILLFMPEGNYFIYSELHGEISTPHAKRMLPRLIQRMGEEYAERDFAGTIIGFKRVADNITPSKDYEQIYLRRQKARDDRRAAWNALRKRVQRRSKRR